MMESADKMARVVSSFSDTAIDGDECGGARKASSRIAFVLNLNIRIMYHDVKTVFQSI